jgi:hypothetical protein
MSLALSWPLQRGLVAALSAHPVIAAEIGPRIFDAPPHADALGDAARPWLLIGEETVAPWPGAAEGAAIHVLALSVVGADAGFGRLKQVAAAISEAALSLSGGAGFRIALAHFIDGAARRGPDAGLRRIDQRIRFHAEPA